jgi:hypothetical protein
VRWGVQHAWESKELHTTFWHENIKKRDNLEELDIDLRMILKWT